MHFITKPPIFEEIFKEDFEKTFNENFENTETCYVNLMKQCWNEESERRPSADKVVEAFTKWQNDDQILLTLTKSGERFKQVMNQITSGEIIYSDEIYSDKTYSDKIYSDKFYSDLFSLNCYDTETKDAGEINEKDLRVLAPSEFEVKVGMPEDKFASTPEFNERLVTRSEYLEYGSNICLRKFGLGGDEIDEMSE
ncbi:6439_t:CDS:2 [Cetraspora pellucida]|uniref:6439_t:CDS:1 n=1 Tax=Cetraspora pellucida TaxID=1433469 RepID=A0ACA9KCV2_9GLOM|nr:6439_t:CDS:2 [Cetraspora pellucida]